MNTKQVKSLKVLQASLQVFYQKLNNIHWNVKGLEFFEIHEQTDKLYHEMIELIDGVAEKIVMNDGIALGSFKEILEISKINEIESKHFDYLEASKIIEQDLKTLIDVTNSVETSPTIQPLLDEIYMVCDKYKWQFGVINKK